LTKIRLLGKLCDSEIINLASGKMRIQVDDIVEVITGSDRGERGKVLRVDREKGKLLVEGINKVYKHVRRSQKNPQGGRLLKEMPIQASNVLIVCPKTNKPSRIGIRIAKDGSKERFAKASGATISVIAPPKKKKQTAKA
jgi:large subunit ribosomal protein L24